MKASAISAAPRQLFSWLVVHLSALEPLLVNDRICRLLSSSMTGMIGVVARANAR